jgi:hypothetical protein
MAGIGSFTPLLGAAGKHKSLPGKQKTRAARSADCQTRPAIRARRMEGELAAVYDQSYTA